MMRIIILVINDHYSGSSSSSSSSRCSSGSDNSSNNMIKMIMDLCHGLITPCANVPTYTHSNIIIIIITFKGAIRDLLQSPHSAANCLQHVRSSDLGAIVCKSRAAHQALIMCKCHVTYHLVRRDSSAIKFDRVEIAFI